MNYKAMVATAVMVASVVMVQADWAEYQGAKAEFDSVKTVVNVATEGVRSEYKEIKDSVYSAQGVLAAQYEAGEFFKEVDSDADVAEWKKLLAIYKAKKAKADKTLEPAKAERDKAIKSAKIKHDYKKYSSAVRTAKKNL